MTLHIVKRDETLSSIARMYDTTVASLTAANQIGDGGKLAVGQALVVPPYGAPSRSILVNGYALPGIGDAALYGALPYLSYLTPFAYRARADGSLSDLADSAMIRQAYANDVAPIMAVSNQKEGGGFDGSIGHALLTDMAAQEALIQNMLRILSSKNYMGLNVDFEYLPQQDGPAYADFLRRLKRRLAPGGYQLSAALAPKTGPEQTGTLYTAHDYAAIGEICDLVILMTYEWGYTYGPPQAVAPIEQVEKVLTYAVSVMPSRKILMGMPNYGYNWTLPYETGRPARTVALADAPRLAYENFADIRYDQKAQAPFFQFYDSNGAEHIVWFDDARSILARLTLVQTYDLGGVSYWNIDRLYRPGFLVLSSMFRIEKMFD
ncbi:MAG: glycosyl hydrolase family 18 protein [Candidatus Pelethousia sp.]|nr:glycosyl hydrolase family 18 protein [Candidatus Pelethousia sp.]